MFHARTIPFHEWNRKQAHIFDITIILPSVLFARHSWQPLESDGLWHFDFGSKCSKQTRPPRIIARAMTLAHFRGRLSTVNGVWVIGSISAPKKYIHFRLSRCLYKCRRWVTVTSKAKAILLRRLVKKFLLYGLKLYTWRRLHWIIEWFRRSKWLENLIMRGNSNDHYLVFEISLQTKITLFGMSLRYYGPHRPLFETVFPLIMAEITDNNNNQIIVKYFCYLV